MVVETRLLEILKFDQKVLLTSPNYWSNDAGSPADSPMLSIYCAFSVLAPEPPKESTEGKRVLFLWVCVFFNHHLIG